MGPAPFSAYRSKEYFETKRKTACFVTPPTPEQAAAQAATETARFFQQEEIGMLTGERVMNHLI
jgi:hypothetical protein